MLPGCIQRSAVERVLRRLRQKDAELLRLLLAQLGEDCTRTLPMLARGPFVSPGPRGGAEHEERLGLASPLVELPEQRQRPPVPLDRLLEMALPGRHGPQVVQGPALTPAITNRPQDRQCRLVVPGRLVEAILLPADDAQAVEVPAHTPSVERGPEDRHALLEVGLRGPEVASQSIQQPQMMEGPALVEPVPRLPKDRQALLESADSLVELTLLAVEDRQALQGERLAVAVQRAVERAELAQDDRLGARVAQAPSRLQADLVRPLPVIQVCAQLQEAPEP